MKKTLEAWLWSLRLLARSPFALVGLGVLSALWVLAAYQWLALPESSALMLVLTFVWGLAQVLIAISALAGTAASAVEAAGFGSPPSSGLTFVTFNRRLLARTVLLALGGAILAYLVSLALGWVDAHTVEIASFLTFHSQKPTSHIVIEKILWWIEAAVWIVVCGFLLTFLMTLLRSGWGGAFQQSKHIFANCLYRGSFLTVVVGVLVFGWLSNFLFNWHPQVMPGFWDYTEAVLRLGFGLLLLVAGWFFTLLSLARLNPRQDSSTQT